MVYFEAFEVGSHGFITPDNKKRIKKIHQFCNKNIKFKKLNNFRKKPKKNPKEIYLGNGTYKLIRPWEKFPKNIPKDQKMSISNPDRVTAQSMEQIPRDQGQTGPVSL